MRQLFVLGPMIALFTDFGAAGPYVGQVKVMLYQQLTHDVAIIDLISDVPAYDIKSAAYLLAAYTRGFPPSTVFLCVVDPGVGDSIRRPIVVKIDENWFVGPDNGLFNIVARNKKNIEWFEIIWRPEKLSSTFHGRDLFAPITAKIVNGNNMSKELRPIKPVINKEWPDDLDGIIYIDCFGNAITGVNAFTRNPDQRIKVNNEVISFKKTYSDVPEGGCFWYCNANGLVELAVNQGKAVEYLGLKVGDPIEWVN